jgi:hypothetical protein
VRAKCKHLKPFIPSRVTTRSRRSNLSDAVYKGSEKWERAATWMVAGRLSILRSEPVIEGSSGHHRLSPSASTDEVFEARCPMAHKFQVGQTVLPAHPRRANPDTYVIVQALPETSHGPQYRIRALSSAAECIVDETQIKKVRAEADYPLEVSRH